MAWIKWLDKAAVIGTGAYKGARRWLRGKKAGPRDNDPIPRNPTKNVKEDAKKGDGKKASCKGKCPPKKPQRRHDPCKVRGKDPSKSENSMIDPDFKDKIGAEISDIIAGKVPKTGDNWVVNGRTYGSHGSGTSLFPRSGEGIVQFDRLQHQYNTRLNTVGYEQANFELEKRGNPLSETKKETVEKMWKKCKK